MLKSYFRIAWRSLLKNKGYSSINIVGLATGMAIAGLIGLWIADEVSFDFYHRNHADIAQVMLNQTTNGDTYTGSVVAIPLGEALHNQYGNHFKYVAHASFPQEHLLVVGDKKLLGSGIWTQQEFPEMFTLRLVSGNAGALKDPSTLLLSRSFATALFGEADATNKTVRLDNKLDMKVGGVYEDLPHNTTFYGTKFLLPWDSKENVYMNTNTDWGDHNGFLYVQLTGKETPAQITAQIKNLPTPYVKDAHEEALVYPLDKMHLYSEFTNGKPSGGLIQSVRLFGIIGAFVLLLACINFMNLSTARSEKRAKEVGIRKTIGSLRKQLIAQFLSESILVAFLAFILAACLMIVSLPFFNNLADKQLIFPWSTPLFWILAIGFTLFTGIVSGSYPAFYLSGFEPIKVLKGTARFRTSSERGTTLWTKFIRAGRYASLPRQILVVLQFSVSLSLIIGTIIVYRQIQYAKDRPIGYTRAGLITVNINTPDLNSHYDALRADLIQTGAVDNIAGSSQPLNNFGSNNSLYWRGKRPDQESIWFNNVNVTPEFGKTIGWQVTGGRDFSRSFTTDSNAMILNEASVKAIGILNPIGELMTFFGKRYTVVGIVKDMVTNSPYSEVRPAIFLGDGYHTKITIRLKAGLPTHTALAGIEPVFKKYDPGSPFVYQFNDEGYAAKFDAEERIGHLSSVFAAFAIFISCLGLFGLASFVAEQRTKEIGVRKVLGANLFTLWGLLLKDFVKLVLLSLFISIPVAYYAMHQWLQNYIYRTGMPWWIFAAAGLGILLITLLTVSFQSLKAALMNPVKSLRSE